MNHTPLLERLPRAGVLLALLLAAAPAIGAEAPPGLTTIAVGWFDQDAIGLNMLWFDQGSAAGTADTWSLRLEQRFGGASAWQPLDWLTARPWVAGEVTGDAAIWAGGGGLVDVGAGPLVVTASIGAGLYHRGQGKDLGYPLEFRTGLEAGWVFDGGWRVTAGYYHMSNAEIRPDDNPGQNTLLLMLHVPDLWTRLGRR